MINKVEVLKRNLNSFLLIMIVQYNNSDNDDDENWFR
jgi:hypothetical protein